MHASPDARSLMSEALDLIEGDACIWCERRPKGGDSHLCDDCRRDDPDGMLRRAFQLQALPAHIST